MSALAAITMRAALSDPELLGNVLAGPSWLPWRATLIGANGEPLTDDEREVFTRLSGREREPLERVDELWAVVGRRGGKSRAVAALAAFLSCFVDYSSVLAPGERALVLCIAATARQAQIVFDYIGAILATTPLLSGLVTNRTADVISLSNNVDIEVKAANFRSIRGVTCVAVIADEAAFLRSDENSANSDSDVFNAVRPSLGTTGGLFVAISSPWSRRGEFWETYRRHYGPGGDKRILVVQGATRAFNSTLPQNVVDRAFERDASAASAEYGAEFRSDLEAFVTIEAVQACVDKGVFERAPNGEKYFGAADPSGGSADSFTGCVGHKRQDGLIIVDAVREYAAPCVPETVAQELSIFFKRYGVKQIRSDRYAGMWPKDAFARYGITCEQSAAPKSDLYAELLPLINSRGVALLDNQRLISQLVGLERRTARSGRDSIDHQPSSRDDVINCVALLASMLTENGKNLGFYFFYRDQAAMVGGGIYDAEPVALFNGKKIRGVVRVVAPPGAGTVRLSSGADLTIENGVADVPVSDLGTLLSRGWSLAEPIN